jgi:hypothetical protein
VGAAFVGFPNATGAEVYRFDFGKKNEKKKYFMLLVVFVVFLNFVFLFVCVYFLSSFYYFILLIFCLFFLGCYSKDKCSAHGSCVIDSCVCSEGFGGVDCSQILPAAALCKNSHTHSKERQK